MNIKDKRVVVLIPCFNEEMTIGRVISDFKDVLGNVDIYVYDNNSSDRTLEVSKESGAIVKRESRQGKGNVIRRMFRDIDADAYILVDGDDTYPACFSLEMIKLVLEDGIDMVIGDRLSNGAYAKENKRGFHGFGNSLVKNLINSIFKSDINDIMTGYRCFSKKFVKTNAIMSKGFQIETELTIKALVYRYYISQIVIDYRDRPIGSHSKLSTFKDGFKVLVTLFDLCKGYKPLLFFGSISLIFLVMGIIIGLPVIYEFIMFEFVYKVPSAILSSSLIIVSLLIMILGLISDHITNKEKRDHEMFVNNYIYNERNKI